MGMEDLSDIHAGLTKKELGSMKLIMHPYQTENDYWRVRPFLREVFTLNGRRELSWHVARWDYWRWPGVESWGDGPLEGRVFIWEMPHGQIAAVLNSEGRGDAYMQVHPNMRTPELEAEMLDLAEQHLTTTGAYDQRELHVWADSNDVLRQGVLMSRGYTLSNDAETQHRWTAHQPIPDKPVAEGHTVRSLGEVDELPARAWFTWKAFHPDEPEEIYASLGWQWYHDIQRCPLYRRDLDLVAVAPNGDFAAFTTVWYDDVTRSAYFEPVATYQPHQRRGLASAVMREGLRRVKRLGATVAFVGGLSPEANALYTTVMGTEHDVMQCWVKGFRN